jgi:hypothetical protein
MQRIVTSAVRHCVSCTLPFGLQLP